MTIGFYKWDLTKKIWPLKSDLRSDEVFDHRNDGRSFGTDQRGIDHETCLGMVHYPHSSHPPV